MSRAFGFAILLLVTGCDSQAKIASDAGPDADVDAGLDAGTDAGQGRALILLHTNDEHSHLIGFGPEYDDHPAPSVAGTGTIQGGIGRRAALLAKERAAAAATGAAVLTVSAGDTTMGTLVEVPIPGVAPDFAAMKRLGYDVSTLGNHELDFGPARLAAAIGAQQTAGGLVPTVASNIHFSASDPLDDTLAALFDESGGDASKPLHRSLVITTSNGLKVGFIGIVGADAQASATLRRPVEFSTAASGSDADYPGVLAQLYLDVQPVVDHLRADLGVEVVVALSHSGVKLADETSGEDYQIATHVNGLDVIVSGHSHTLYPARLVTNPTTHKPVLIQQAGQLGQYLGRISLQVGADGSVDFDLANSQVLPVDDTVVSDPSYDAVIDSAIHSLEATPLASGRSFLETALGEVTGTSVAHDPLKPGDLYFYNLGKTSFDVGVAPDHKETPLLVLSADATLATVDALGIGKTDVAMRARGPIRADLKKGRTGTLAFGDVFRVLPFGASPGDGSLGFPLCRLSVLAVELKSALEQSAGFSYTTDSAAAYFLVTAGLEYEYDTSRPVFNPGGSPLDPNNGRITRIAFAGDHSKPDTFDQVIFDASAGGFTNGFTVASSIVATMDLFLASVLYGEGINLRSPDGTQVNLAPAATILRRADNSEVKDYEALAQYILRQTTANGGTLPARYDLAGGLFPRRAICSGPLCI